MYQYRESDGTKSFTALDYVAVTPHWSVIGDGQRGFDPKEKRWTRKSKSKAESGC